MKWMPRTASSGSTASGKMASWHLPTSELKTSSSLSRSTKKTLDCSAGDCSACGLGRMDTLQLAFVCQLFAGRALNFEQDDAARLPDYADDRVRAGPISTRPPGW